MYALFNEQHTGFCKRILIKCNFFLFPNLEPNSCGGPVTLDIITEGALSDLAALLPGQAPDSVSCREDPLEKLTLLKGTVSGLCPSCWALPAHGSGNSPDSLELTS